MTNAERTRIHDIIENGLPNRATLLRYKDDETAICSAFMDNIVDPDLKTKVMRAHFTGVVSPILSALLKQNDYRETLRTAFEDLALENQAQITKKLDDIVSRLAFLEDQARKNKSFERMREEGITEKAILRLAKRIATDTDDLGQAWAELESAIEIAIRVQREGHACSNHGDFVDTVLVRVAKLSAEGAYERANDAIDEALAREATESLARQLRLIDTRINLAVLAGNVNDTANFVIEKVTRDSSGLLHSFASLGQIAQDVWLDNGRDKGLNFDLQVSLKLADTLKAWAQKLNLNGPADQLYGTVLLALGERQSSNGLIEEAEIALRKATKATPRSHLPLMWASAQTQLGLALSVLGEREKSSDRLRHAVSAFGDALAEYKRDKVPDDWALAQNNLGNALRSLGKLERGKGWLAKAKTAYLAALEVRTREKAPRKWAMTQNNLGNTLQAIGEREHLPEHHEQAVKAYRDALIETNRDHLPLSWALTQNNLGNALFCLSTYESDTRNLDKAISAFRSALEVRTRERVPFDWGATKCNLGKALTTLALRHENILKLDEAANALADALLETPKADLAIDWAGNQMNICTLQLAYCDLTTNPTHLDKAQAALDGAREVFTEAQASHYLSMADTSQSLIDQRRAAL